MMRITNSMMMNTTKTNINNNKTNVDRLNTQMSTQKKITKPSDNPLIAIKSLRLSTTLSKINQYYNNNSQDAESWLDVTETALTNMKDIMSDAYRLCVQGATDTLGDEDRSAILQQLQGLSSQLYAEANADYADRTIFTGYKTNSTVAFTDASEASEAKYQISEQLSYKDIETYSYYANKLDTPSDITVTPATPQEEQLKRLRLSYDTLDSLKGFSYSCAVDTSDYTTGSASILSKIDTTVGAAATTVTTSQDFQWRSQKKDSNFNFQADNTGAMQDKSDTMDGTYLEDLNGYRLQIASDGSFSVNDSSVQDETRSSVMNGKRVDTVTYTDANGKELFTTVTTYTQGSTANAQTADDYVKESAKVVDSQGNVVTITFKDVGNGGVSTAQDVITSITDPQGNTIDLSTASKISITNGTRSVLTATTDAATTNNTYTLNTADKGLSTQMKITTFSQSDFEDYLSELAAGTTPLTSRGTPAVVPDENTLIYLPHTGEVVLGSTLASNLVSESAILNVDYVKEGFDKGEARPEMYFNCINMTDPSPANYIKYTNYDEDGNWISQDINYTVSNNQELAINTQIHDVVDEACYRDLEELTEIVQDAIDAHTTVANINNMMSSSEYADDASQVKLQDWLEKAEKQMAYADDHLQKVYGTQITHFENYKATVDLAITNAGTKGDQLSLAENRMSNMQVTFKDLKSKNEDEELSDVTIDYTSAYTAFQASLQAAGKIDDMSLLDYL